MPNPTVSADLLSLNPLNLLTAIRALEAQGVEEFHFDIADGRFIPRFGFAPEVIAAVKAESRIPCHAHLMLAEPEKILPEILRCGADIVTLHIEACTHLHRALTLIRDAGIQAGLAVLPATSLTKINYVFPGLNRLLVLGTDPVVRTAGMPRAAFERLRLLNENIRYHEYAVGLEIEGPLSPEDAARCVRFGATHLRIGADDVHGLGQAERPEALREYREQFTAALHTV